MLQSQKLELRASQIRKRLREIAALEGDKLTDEIRTESAALQTEFEDVETRRQAAIVAEGEKAGQEPDGEGREMSALEQRVSLGSYLHSIANGRALSGAEAELQKQRGLSGDGVPWAAIAPAPSPAPEARAGVESRAVTPGPTTLPGQETFVERVFKRSAAAWMGVMMPTVPAGQSTWHLISAGPAADAKAKDGAADETAGAFTSKALTPVRLTAAYQFRVEEIAEHSMMEAALRRDLSAKLSEALDTKVIAGNGTAPNPTGIINLSDPGDDSNVINYATAKAMAAGNVDGIYSADLMDVKALVGAKTFEKLNEITPTNDDSRDALSWWLANTGGVRVNADIPAPASNLQRAVIAKTGARISAYCPTWEGVRFITDIYTGAGEGQVTITALALFNFSVVDVSSFVLRDLKLA